MMKKSGLFILLILLIFTSGCNKEKAEYRLSDFDIPVITGYYLRDEQGIPMRTIGTPNVRLGNESNDFTSDYYLMQYPNPCDKSCVLNIKSPSGQSIKKVWVVQASYFDQMPGSENELNMISLNTGGAPLLQAETTSRYLKLDLTSFKTGYYRVYVKIDDQILYDNLVINKSNPE
jgi:hypothetical protein